MMKRWGVAVLAALVLCGLASCGQAPPHRAVTEPHGVSTSGVEVAVQSGVAWAQSDELAVSAQPPPPRPQATDPGSPGTGVGEPAGRFDVQVIAGREATTIATVSGTGTIAVTMARDTGSTAPNLPTYISSICDGASVYSGAFNTTGGGPFTKDVPFSGESCSVRVKVDQPSSRWSGTWSAVNLTIGATSLVSGEGSVIAADWASRPVNVSDSFELATPAGFEGTLSIKMTACSSEGGTSDATVTSGCAGLVQRDVASSISLDVTDASGLLAHQDVTVTADTHHDTITLFMARPSVGPITLTVTWTAGSAMLIHGPGTRAVGVIR